MNSDPVPASIFDARISLATAMHAQPGVYALLLGSGTSTAAGVPTGWGVVQALVAKAAAASGLDVPDDLDPEVWWREHGDGAPLGYSSLLASLASTPAARRAMLAGYFEPSDEDREQGIKVPGAAHRAIAALVRRGAVRVIVTTNFDRLIEQPSKRRAFCLRSSPRRARSEVWSRSHMLAARLSNCTATTPASIN